MLLLLISMLLMLLMFLEDVKIFLYFQPKFLYFKLSSLERIDEKGLLLHVLNLMFWKTNLANLHILMFI